MWFTASKKEFNFKGKHMIGSIWAVQKGSAGMVKCSKIVWTPSENLSQEITFTCDQEDARKMFITPNKSLDAILEESVYLSEGAYC